MDNQRPQPYPTLFEKDSALFESLARNHCFHNGNKRTPFAAVDTFLKKNGYKIKKMTQGMRILRCMFLKEQLR
ncbi:type II toxin-antitoxin system death-on-curing family toxin [Salibacterium salarium]|uniref:type II toxin-antitoxin system death-on-curing family toxin n=1 Tax=Salibacterium salarium TaxID=284579 RepID=UPI0027D848B0|nr:type II toxin-antitoxin system death-on-curing family toxin [Salibacterium salarium]